MLNKRNFYRHAAIFNFNGEDFGSSLCEKVNSGFRGYFCTLCGLDFFHSKYP